MTMRFGQYRGWPLEELPDDYLRWLGTIELRPPLDGAVRAEVRARRYRTYEHPPAPHDGITLRISVAHAPLVRDLVDTGYRTLAKRLHPDQGGDAGQMQTLNAAVAHLREQLGVLA